MNRNHNVLKEVAHHPVEKNHGKSIWGTDACKKRVSFAVKRVKRRIANASRKLNRA